MKDKKILYGIIITFVFLLSIGLTYAYFSVTTNVVGDRNDIKASVGTLSILYTDGPEIVAENIQPGWKENKTITVKNTGTLDAYYSIVWASLTNEINSNELVISGSCETNIDECPDILLTPVYDDEIAIGVAISPGEEQTYYLSFEFIETGSAQNYNQGKNFNGVLNIVEANEAVAITGSLVDSNDNPIEGATIEIHSTVRTGITDSNGDFNIIGVEPGEHEVIVKNSSNVSIATDTISILKGENESVNAKQVTVDKSKEIIDVKIELSATNIDSITILKWYDRCSAESVDIKCKMLADNTEYADNISSTYVSSPSGINFNNISSDTNGKGLYYTTNSSKTENGERVYYFRGDVENNYFKTGRYCWRIVRTVEDGSVRLRYGGEVNNGECPQTGTNVSVTSAVFNDLPYDNAYLGYMYGTAESSTYGLTHTNSISSTIKIVLDAWYNSATTSNQECYNGSSIDCDFSASFRFSRYTDVIADTPYCNDRSIGTGGTIGGTLYTEFGYDTNSTMYAAGRRFATNGPTGTTFGNTYSDPTYKCSQNNDKFTVSNRIGNGSLTNPLGLLTVDEASYAGIILGTENSTNYLNTGETYWLMSPIQYNEGGYIYTIYPDGSGMPDPTFNIYAVLPAISLNSTSNIDGGNGSYDSPYNLNYYFNE